MCVCWGVHVWVAVGGFSHQRGFSHDQRFSVKSLIMRQKDTLEAVFCQAGSVWSVPAADLDFSYQKPDKKGNPLFMFFKQ